MDQSILNIIDAARKIKRFQVNNPKGTITEPQHHGFCNYPTYTKGGKFCNCGITDLLVALDKYEQIKE